jgi:hypothetical protein
MHLTAFSDERVNSDFGFVALAAGEAGLMAQRVTVLDGSPIELDGAGALERRFAHLFNPLAHQGDGNAVKGRQTLRLAP